MLKNNKYIIIYIYIHSNERGKYPQKVKFDIKYLIEYLCFLFFLVNRWALRSSWLLHLPLLPPHSPSFISLPPYFRLSYIPESQGLTLAAVAAVASASVCAYGGVQYGSPLYLVQSGPVVGVSLV